MAEFDERQVDRLAALLYEDQPVPARRGWDDEYEPLKEHFRAKARRFIKAMDEPLKPAWPTDESCLAWKKARDGITHDWPPSCMEDVRRLLHAAMGVDPIVTAAVALVNAWDINTSTTWQPARTLFLAVRDAGLLRR